jgi:anti-sigma-K factor RskA
VAGDDGADVSGRVVTLAPVEPLGGDARGTATLSGRTATVRLSGLQPTRDGQFYELWLLNSPDDLVSLGSFAVPASGEIDVSVPVPGDAGSFSAFDVSREPPDGNPAHSSKSVLRAPLAS